MSWKVFDLDFDRDKEALLGVGAGVAPIAAGGGKLGTVISSHESSRPGH